MKYKRCGTCGKNKTVDRFTKNKSLADGLERRCKQCVKDYVQKKPSVQKARLKASLRWNAKNRSKAVGYTRAYMIRKRHNLSVGEYNSLINKSGGLCECCELSTRKPSLRKLEDGSFIILCYRCIRKRMFKRL